MFPKQNHILLSNLHVSLHLMDSPKLISWRRLLRNLLSLLDDQPHLKIKKKTNKNEEEEEIVEDVNASRMVEEGWYPSYLPLFNS